MVLTTLIPSSTEFPNGLKTYLRPPAVPVHACFIVVCLHSDTRTHVHTYTHSHMHTLTHSHTQAQKHTHTHIHTYMHTYIHTLTHSHIHTCKTCKHVHTHTHTNIYTFTHSHIHTYTNTHTISGFRRKVHETALFWDITQRRVVIPYRCFGTSQWFHLQALRTESMGCPET